MSVSRQGNGETALAVGQVEKAENVHPTQQLIDTAAAFVQALNSTMSHELNGEIWSHEYESEAELRFIGRVSPCDLFLESYCAFPADTMKHYGPALHVPRAERRGLAKRLDSCIQSARRGRRQSRPRQICTAT